MAALDSPLDARHSTNQPVGMTCRQAPNPPPPRGKKLLNAALSVIRTKGYSATTVDELCAAAGVTKGARSFTTSRARTRLASQPRTTGLRPPARCLLTLGTTTMPTRWPACSAMSPCARHCCKAACPISPAWSAPWCRRPTTPVPPYAMPASAASAAMHRSWRPDIAAAMRERGMAPGWTAPVAGAAHPGRAARRLHPRQGQGRRGRGRRQRGTTWPAIWNCLFQPQGVSP